MLSRFIDTAKLQTMLAALMSLASCQHHDDSSGAADGAGDEPLGEMVSCALNNSSVFNEDCRLERDAGGLLVIHNPDGSFVRLRLAPGGTVTTEDGFLKATSHPADNGAIAVDVGDDHYIIRPSNPDDAQAGPSGDAGMAGDAGTGSGNAGSQ